MVFVLLGIAMGAIYGLFSLFIPDGGAWMAATIASIGLIIAFTIYATKPNKRDDDDWHYDG
jgi:hypothetical protein